MRANRQPLPSSKPPSYKALVKTIVFLLIFFPLCVYASRNNPAALFWNPAPKEDLTPNASYPSAAGLRNVNSNQAAFGTDVVNILAFGLDKDTSRAARQTTFRPDTIVFASIDTKNKTISLISIPRDTRVKINGKNAVDKINACFAYAYSRNNSDEENYQAGAACLVETAKDLLGVPIHYYVGADMDGAVRLIDLLGGVDVDVHANIYSNGVKKLSKGRQKLNGAEFMVYARNRLYPNGDIERVEVQQKLFQDLIKKAASPETFLRLPKLLSGLGEVAKTDMDFKKLTSLIFSISECDFSNIRSGTVPGKFLDIDGISYWEVSTIKTKQFVKSVLQQEHID
ncbi:MAG: LCP family protein [Eubacteriaceae bacterium]|nr:LCP family protein [Eubacteriaceae bacterium]